MTYVSDALCGLRDVRAALLAELVKIDGAIRQLEGDNAPSVSVAARGAAKTAGTARARTRSGSVKSKVLALLREDPDRIWTITDIIDTFIERGDPVHREGSQDRGSPVRTALMHAATSGLAEKVANGKYRAARAETPVAAGVSDSSDLSRGEGVKARVDHPTDDQTERIDPYRDRASVMG